DLYVVIVVGDCHHVRVGINVLLKELRIPAVGTESNSPVVKGRGGNPALAGIDQAYVLRVTSPEVIQNGGAEGMDKAKLPVGGATFKRIGKSAGAGGGTGA